VELLLIIQKNAFIFLVCFRLLNNLLLPCVMKSWRRASWCISTGLKTSVSFWEM